MRNVLGEPRWRKPRTWLQELTDSDGGILSIRTVTELQFDEYNEMGKHGMILKLKEEHLIRKVEIKEGFLEEVMPKVSWVLRISKGQPGEEGMVGANKHFHGGNLRITEALGNHGLPQQPQ